MNQNNLELLWFLAKTDFKLRYHGSLLGFLWSLLKPMAIFFVLNFVFSYVIKVPIKNFQLRLLTGLVIFFFFQETTSWGMLSFANKAHLLVKVSVPRWILVFSTNLNLILTLLINLVILTVFYIIYGIFPSFLAVFHFVFLLFLLIIFVSAFCLLTAPLYLKLKDLSHIWEVLMQVIFYSAPIIYPLTMIPDKIRNYLYLNPLTSIIHFSQSVLIEGKFPATSSYLILIAVFSAFFIFSWLIFQMMSPRAAENI